MVYDVGVVTISDTASRDSTANRSGPELVGALSSADGLRVTTRRICADEKETIRRTVLSMMEHDGVRLVVTTGGTGLGVRDVTPEALTPLLIRPTPALTHALTAHSLRQTPLAALSRLVTGVWCSGEGADARQSLIVALPGSPKAVRECMDVLLANHLLLHALDLLSGESGQPLHQQMQHGEQRSHHAGCGGLHAHTAPKPRTTERNAYRTHDPAGGPSVRLRQSPYPIIALDEALALIERNTPTPTRTVQLPLSSKSEELVGCVLAETVVAPCDLPPGPTTNVDGYAVDSAMIRPGIYTVVTLSDLQQRHDDDTTVQADQVFRINTGQALPRGTDAVVMVEDTELEQSDASALGGREVSVRILTSVPAGENVRARGSDVRAHQAVLPTGTTISPLGGEIGTLAFLGHRTVTVYRKPTVGILSTGNELIDPLAEPDAATTAAPPARGTMAWGFSVYDANRPSLIAAVQALGFATVDLGIVRDDADATQAALERGLRETDVVITTGGTSMGESDLLKPLLERQLHAHIHFGRVAMKPGKPTTFATTRRRNNDAASPPSERLIFALPGNPASALVTFYVFVLPALRKLSGIPPSPEHGWALPRTRVTLASKMRLDARPEFHRVLLKSTAAHGLVAYSTGSQRSSGMQSMSCANGLVALPARRADGPEAMEAGALADAIILGPIV